MSLRSLWSEFFVDILCRKWSHTSRKIWCKMGFPYLIWAFRWLDLAYILPHVGNWQGNILSSSLIWVFGGEFFLKVEKKVYISHFAFFGNQRLLWKHIFKEIFIWISFLSSTLSRGNLLMHHMGEFINYVDKILRIYFPPSPFIDKFTS